MSVLIFLIVLSVLVLIHEAGHYFVAKKFGVWVEEFGWGIPPRAWGKKIGETLYSINWLPFGGFVRLHGEESEKGLSKPERAFVNKTKLQRSLIVSAGVFMNFLLAIVLFAVVYSVTGIPKDTGVIKVHEIESGSPAEMSGLKVNDEILTVDGVEYTKVDEFVKNMDSKRGSEVNLVVKNSDGEKNLTITPRVSTDESQGALGVLISTVETYYPPVWQRPFYGIYYGFKEAIFWGMTVIGGFAYIFKSLFAGDVPQGIAGPVGIYAITTQAASFGILSLFNFMAILSMNLAILNIFPFPSLDGGRLLFIILEAIFGKKVLPKIENYIHMAGMAFLLLLIVLVTFGDLKNLYVSGWNIEKFLQNMAP